MKSIKAFVGLFVLLAVGIFPQTRDNGFWGTLSAGSFVPGFRLIEEADGSRSFPLGVDGAIQARPMRIYIWYPAARNESQPLRLNDYVQMAGDDFKLKSPLPVALAKGIEAAAMAKLLESPTAAVRDAAPAPGKFPLLVLGQGLFYESPLTHFVLCEFLASQGFVVATCPLLGTQYRLVNINIEDVETEVRDMEYALGRARSLPFTDSEKIGVIGFDLGGMAGILLAMRHPEAKAFLSMDSGVLDRHPSGIPIKHPDYREDRFVIPWMHMNQARAIRSLEARKAAPSLFERKEFGDSYIVPVPTRIHGAFSSYAALGLTKAVPGYWGAIEPDLKKNYGEICRLNLAFFERYLKQDGRALDRWLQAGRASDGGAPTFTIEAKEGRQAPPTQAALVNRIIEKGMGEAGLAIERVRTAYPAIKLIDEPVLNWLGVHFLNWWGREEEAVEVLKLNVSLYPASWEALNSLGEACFVTGRTEDAIRAYTKSQEINPQDPRAKTMLERLKKSAPDSPKK
jgi:tetratricopeptide (TPR) repeat protein